MPEYVTLGRRFRVLRHRAASEWVGRVIASRHAFYLFVEAWPSWWADDWDSGATADVWNGLAGDAIKRPGTPLSRLGEVAGHPDWPLRGVTNDSVVVIPRHDVERVRLTRWAWRATLDITTPEQTYFVGLRLFGRGRALRQLREWGWEYEAHGAAARAGALPSAPLTGPGVER